MFTSDISLSVEEPTFSASTLIGNQYALESPLPERDAKALLRAVFHHSLDASADSDDEGSPKLSSRCNSPHTSSASPRRPQGPSGSSIVSLSSSDVQTEWIYRRPKSSSPATNNNSLVPRHRSASACPPPQLSRSPSIPSRTHRDDTSFKHRRRAAAMPRPSSPVLISSTSQLVDSPKSIAKTRVRGAANASVSSLQLQSAIRVSPLTHRTHRSPYLPMDKISDPGVTPSLQRSTTERNPLLKSIPFRYQIVMGSSFTPTVPVPLTSSLPTPPRDAIPPRVPPKDRHFNGTATSSLVPSLSHTERHRRDKFASAPPIPVSVGANAPSTRFVVRNSSSAPSPSSHSRSGFGGSSVSGFQRRNHASASTLIAMPLSASTRHPSLPPPASSSVSLSHHGSSYGSSYVSRSPRTPITAHASQIPPKPKSILTRSIRAGCSKPLKPKTMQTTQIDSEVAILDADISRLSKRRAALLRQRNLLESPICRLPAELFSRIISLSIEPIRDVWIDSERPSTLTTTGDLFELGSVCSHWYHATKNSGCGATVKSVKFVEIPEIHYRSGFSEEDSNDYIYGETSGLNDEDGDDDDDISAVGAKGEGQESIVLKDCMRIDVEAIDMDIDTYLGCGPLEEEEAKLSFTRKRGLGWNFWGRKHEREVDEGKEVKQIDDEKESAPEKKFMGLTSPLPTPVHENANTNDTSKKRTSVSPSRKPISGPHALGSHLPSRPPLPGVNKVCARGIPVAVAD